MTNRWTDDEKEKLFIITSNFLDEITKKRTLSPSSEIILRIHRLLQNTTRNLRSILYKLSEMGFLKKGKDTHRTSRFFVNNLKRSDILCFNASPGYEDLPPLQRYLLKCCFLDYALFIYEIEELCESMSSALQLSSLRIKKELLDQGLIRLNHLIKYELVSPPVRKMKNQTMRSKVLSKELKARINGLRRDLSFNFYNTHQKNNPSITYSSDGTGIGKSYGVMERFIDETVVTGSGSGFRNLLFITPQKAQIDLASGLKKKASCKGIHILSFLARNDIWNIYFKNWITGEENIHIYKRWIDALKRDSNQSIKDTIIEFEKVIHNAKFYHDEIPKLKQRSNFEELKEYEDNQKKNENKLYHLLQKLAKSIIQLQRNGAYIPVEEYFSKAKLNKNGKPNRAAIISEIIDFILPFERAKRTPCILLATSDKYYFKVNIAIEKNNGNPDIISLPFDYIIGQKKHPKQSGEGSGTADYNGRPFIDQINFLKSDYFIIDELNYFRNNDISFTLVVDEEHVAYDRFFNRNHKILFDAETQIPDVFAVINRILLRLDGVTEKDRSNLVLYEAHRKFVSELNTLFETQCDISKGVTLKKILNLFKNSLSHLFIDSSEVEQIIHICKNVFSITPKRFFNEEALKQIRIGAIANSTECRIYYNRDDDDSNPNMHDVLQALMCVFCACAHITDTDFKTMIREFYENTQNAQLHHFVEKALKARSIVEAMFDRVGNENLFIDEFFTYFTPKIVFSIEKIKDLPFKSALLKDKVYVSFRLDLFEALPEVSLMRVLHDTTNAVICLSATSGFKYCYSGNYCRSVLEKFGSFSHNNLGYNSYQRSPDDAKKLQLLRQNREKARNVSIKEFVHTKGQLNSKVFEERKFSQVHTAFFKSIKPYFKSKNPYHYDEFRRQIEALLLAAFDRKHTLILSLSNRFKKIIQEFIQSESAKMLRGLKVIDEEKYRVFEFKPFEQGTTLRVILFNAQLAKERIVEEDLIVDNANTKVVFISSYKSAGTGLNLFIKYKHEGVEEDFERLVLANGPFYSNVLSKNDGLNSVENYVLLLKHYAEETKSYRLKNFDVNLLTGNNYKILMQEHAMSILKEIMQAIGRVERRDTHMETEIYLPSDIVKDLALQYSRLHREGNDLTFQSMSLLNYRLMKYCLDKAARHSFKNEADRKKLSSNIIETGRDIDSFFNTYLKGKRLNDARQGDMTAVKFNESLRSYNCIKDPRKYVDDLLSLPEIREDSFFRHVINHFYLSLDDNLKEITLCTKTNDNRTLTDISHGDRIYKPYNSILPNYHRAIQHTYSTAANILLSIIRDKRIASKNILPHPAILPLFKGNIGEHIFSECLKLMKISPLTVEETFTLLSTEVYELFDFYIQGNNSILCIDVKNWSAFFDKKELALDTHEKALKKRETLLKIASDKGFELKFVYVNTNHDRNAMNLKQEFDQKSAIYYMNLFKVITRYEDTKRSDSKIKSCLEDRLDINPSLIELLGGSLNG